MTDSVETKRAADSTLQVGSQAIYLALMFGAIGAVVGLVYTKLNPLPELTGPGSYGLFAACSASVVAAVVSAIGYVRSRNRPGQEWRQELAPWTFAVNTISVVIVHTALAFLGTYVLFAVLSQALVGFSVLPLFGTIMTAISLGMTAYLVFPSVARMNTQRSSSLLMTFVVLGTTTSAVTSSDASWWKLDFSELGAHNDLSSWIFNGTLIAGGLLVTTFAVYISHDMYALVATGRLSDRSSPRTVAASFITMGVMLAGVGIFPVDEFFWIHTFAASGMGVVYLVLLIGGRRHLSGMPRMYFVSSWLFLAATLVSVVLYLTRFFSLTTLEVIVFAAIFGWIAVFIQFLGAAGEGEQGTV